MTVKAKDIREALKAGRAMFMAQLEGSDGRNFHPVHVPFVYGTTIEITTQRGRLAWKYLYNFILQDGRAYCGGDDEQDSYTQRLMRHVFNKPAFQGVYHDHRVTKSAGGPHEETNE